MVHSNADPGLAELQKERTFGGIGATKVRAVPCIDLSNFEARKAEIADQLWQASTDIGFFQLVNHGVPQEQIDQAFVMTERFFALGFSLEQMRQNLRDLERCISEWAGRSESKAGSVEDAANAG